MLGSKLRKWSGIHVGVAQKNKNDERTEQRIFKRRRACCWSKTRIRAISLPGLRFLFCLAPSFSGTKPNGKSFPTKCRTSGDCSSMPRRNRVVKKLFVWRPWMQHSHNASMNRDKNHACPNIVSKHARHARDSCSPALRRHPQIQVKSSVFLLYIWKSNWTMCISETIHKLEVFIVYFNLTDGKWRIKILAGSFYTDSQGTSKGKKSSNKHL